MTEEHRKDALNGWLEALDRLENDAMCYRDGYGETRKDAETIRAALQSATISETQLESEIKKTALPEFIYVGRVRGDRLICFEADESDETKYIRADIQSPPVPSNLNDNITITMDRKGNLIMNLSDKYSNPPKGE